jgi:hypothetical protein
MATDPSSSLPASHAEAAQRSWLAARLDAADAAAVRWSPRTGSVLVWLLAANALLAAAGVGLGLLLFDDAALWFRELMPGTLLSAAHMLAAAVTARAIHRREPSRRRWYESFWGLSATLLAVLAAVELTQPTVFFSHWLRDTHGVRAPEGISDVDGLLVTLLLVAVVATLAPRALVLLRYPRALAFFAGAALLAAASQFIDATARVSEWEFVVEDGAKALAGPFLLAGYLAALHAIERRRAG